MDSKEIKKTIKEGYTKIAKGGCSCHCGSGEKYKKCCLENDLKKYGGRIRVPTP